ncbi:hypothetical protein ACVWWK_004765 [Bradyrhizobium sp. LB9.1b]
MFRLVPSVEGGALAGIGDGGTNDEEGVTAWEFLLLFGVRLAGYVADDKRVGIAVGTHQLHPSYAQTARRHHMADLTLTTFDWVPEMPRGFVRDLRVRWALEEAALPYRVASVPFGDRDAAHFVHQPFGQVPWLTDGGISIFESGAILLHLGERSAKLIPTDPRGRSEAIAWVFAALNSVEMPSLPWSMLKFMGRCGRYAGVEIRGRLPQAPPQAS